ncbi:type II toxin-antitoxin system RelE/ParE family toxin [Hymenobacter sp. ASUV-10]|uniref:Type II toxin-antitoxin system RelE/ParE family toxin n=1 Tax=Hymenobacter aranciens TaxID=3063996 RepID=A0ABT9BDR6_9BACT|nr:type II toxin-antitoxin system RelE/ParE family toxin [Hymenobacter sp. ASUV-10]MDO7876405.1 type II toxin-antitoxin system RelE/ParE family toxin [Hymenobacter sp. ASUV-10]
MELQFERTFLKDVQRLNDKRIKEKTAALLAQLQQWPTLEAVLANAGDVKKMQGFDGYYRIRLGDFRLGFAIDTLPTGPALRLIRLLHRKEMYRYFP